MALNLQPGEPTRLEAGGRVGDAGRAADDGAVKGQHAGAVEELGVLDGEVDGGFFFRWIGVALVETDLVEGEHAVGGPE